MIGVSFDDPASNQAFAEAQHFGFELWTDTDRTLAMTYGAADSKSQFWASRITVILDAKGTEVLRYDDVDPATHAEQVLEDCRALFGPGRGAAAGK